jgi:hypothetical protein
MCRCTDLANVSKCKAKPKMVKSNENGVVKWAELDHCVKNVEKNGNVSQYQYDY